MKENISVDNMDPFLRDLDVFHIALNNEQIEQFIKYYEILIEWNSFMNLTAIVEFEDVLKKHFLDSLSLINAVPDLTSKPYTLIDMGTGAGFPGIPLKIAFPNLKITLIDSLNKRVKFLNEVIHKLNLQDITAMHGRAEDLARSGRLRESFNLCVSRAVAGLSVLSEYCLPFVMLGGSFIAYKSEKVIEEYQRAEKAIKLLGGNHIRQVEFELPDSDIYRSLVVIKKEKPTPDKFPRQAGLPGKRPITG